MRKLIYSIGVIVLAAAAVFVWSRTALVPLQASTASSISLNIAVASEATAADFAHRYDDESQRSASRGAAGAGVLNRPQGRTMAGRLFN
jgi:hypothetical protein